MCHMSAPRRLGHLDTIAAVIPRTFAAHVRVAGCVVHLHHVLVGLKTAAGKQYALIGLEAAAVLALDADDRAGLILDELDGACVVVHRATQLIELSNKVAPSLCKFCARERLVAWAILSPFHHGKFADRVEKASLARLRVVERCVTHLFEPCNILMDLFCPRLKDILWHFIGIIKHPLINQGRFLVVRAKHNSLCTTRIAAAQLKWSGLEVDGGSQALNTRSDSGGSASTTQTTDNNVSLGLPNRLDRLLGMGDAYDTSGSSGTRCGCGLLRPDRHSAQTNDEK